MDANDLFINAVFSTPDCPDLFERVTAPNAYIAKKMPRTVTDFDKLSLLPFENGCCDVITRSNRDRIMRGVTADGYVVQVGRGEVLGFMPEHFVRLPGSARLNSHNLIVGKIGQFDYQIFATPNHATIEFPKICFPQGAVEPELESTVLRKIKELESGYSKNFEKTGKEYTYFLSSKKAFKADEYKIDNRYVAVAKNSTLKPAVFRVKPIRYAITNFADLPTCINPNGNGTAKAMNIVSVNALMSATVDDIWEFSRLREYANGEFLKEINHCENEEENS